MQRLTRLSSSTLPLVTLLSAALLGFVSGAFAQQTTFELRSGVVVDLDADLVYAMNAAGGIDAVSLALGTVSWHTDDAAKPLATANGQLLAQTDSARPGALSLVVLDSSGRVTLQVSVELPAGVMTRVDDDLAGRFELRAEAVNRSFEVSWRSTRLAPRGALIVDGAEQPQIQSGAPAAGPVTASVTSRPQVETGAFSLDPTTAAVVHRSQPIDGPQPRQVVVPNEERLQAASGPQFFSASRDQILSSESLPEPEIGGPTHRWTIYGKSGDRLGQVDAPSAYAPFFVSDSLILFETHPRAWREGDEVRSEPLTLRALALGSGLEQWSLELRDTEYRGPFPP